MAEYATAYNPSDTPVAVTRAGRPIEGRGWGPVNVDDAHAKALLDAGAIVIAQEPDDLDADGLNPDAVAAFRATADLRAGTTTEDAAEPPAEPSAGDAGDQAATGPGRRTGGRQRSTTPADPQE